MGKFIVGTRSDGTFEALHKAGLINVEPSNVRRCVIDLAAGEAARIYLETFADSELPAGLVAGLHVPEPELVEPPPDYPPTLLEAWHEGYAAAHKTPAKRHFLEGERPR